MAGQNQQSEKEKQEEARRNAATAQANADGGRTTGTTTSSSNSNGTNGKDEGGFFSWIWGGLVSVWDSICSGFSWFGGLFGFGGDKKEQQQPTASAATPVQSTLDNSRVNSNDRSKTQTQTRQAMKSERPMKQTKDTEPTKPGKPSKKSEGNFSEVRTVGDLVDKKGNPRTFTPSKNLENENTDKRINPLVNNPYAGNNLTSTPVNGQTGERTDTATSTPTQGTNPQAPYTTSAIPPEWKSRPSVFGEPTPQPGTNPQAPAPSTSKTSEQDQGTNPQVPTPSTSTQTAQGQEEKPAAQGTPAQGQGTPPVPVPSVPKPGSPNLPEGGEDKRDFKQIALSNAQNSNIG